MVGFYVEPFCLLIHFATAAEVLMIMQENALNKGSRRHSSQKNGAPHMCPISHDCVSTLVT